jgi:hypothetical protein
VRRQPDSPINVVDTRKSLNGLRQFRLKSRQLKVAVGLQCLLQTL